MTWFEILHRVLVVDGNDVGRALTDTSWQKARMRSSQHNTTWHTWLLGRCWHKPEQLATRHLLWRTTQEAIIAHSFDRNDALSVLDAAHWATNRHMNWHSCVMRHLRNQQTMTWRTCGSNCSANRVAVLLDNVSDQRTSLCDVALNLSRDNVDRERETKDMSHCTSTSQSMTLQRQSNDVTDISVWRQNIRFLVFVSPTLIARLWRGWCQIDGQIVVYAPAV